MRKLLGILGLLIGATALKAALWIGRHGAPPSFLPTTVGEKVGFGFVIILVVTFVCCLIWYLVKGKTTPSSERDPK
jgi:hypothetical protein